MIFQTRRQIIKIMMASSCSLAFSIPINLPALAEEAGMEPDTGILIREGKLKEAVAEATKQAEAGEPEGQYQLGLFYWHGMILTQNYFESMKWLTLASLADHKRAKAARLIAIRSIEEATVKRSLIGQERAF